MATEMTDNLPRASSKPDGGVEWTTCPARRQTGLAILGLLVICLLGVLVHVIAGDWIWGVLAVVFLLATLSRFYLSSRLAITPAGVRAEFPLRTRAAAWSEIKWIRHDDRGALIRLHGRKLFRSPEFTILFGDHAEAAVEALQRLAPPELLRPAGGGEQS